MRIRALFVIGALVTTALSFGVPSGAVPSAHADSAVSSSTAPTPVVSGNTLRDSRTGDVFTPHGANWPSFEYACIATSGRGWGYNQGDDTQAAADAMKAWHINTIRIPLNQDCWLGTNANHLYGSAAGYRAAVKQWVDILNADGIVAILDLHWSAPAGKIASNQYPMADAQSLTFWTQVAAAYKSNPSVIFDAFNEPYSRYDGDTMTFQLTWTCWENGGCLAPDVDQNSPLDGKTYPVVGMAAMVAAIRGAGAAQPIELGGLDYSNDLTGWLAHKPLDSQLIASWHNYPGQGCDTVDCWNDQIAPVAAQVPVIASEFGETDGTSTFMTTFMNWADSHGVGYLPWAWWEVDSSESVDNARYALVTGPHFTPKAPAGTAFHDHLAALAGSPTVPPTPPPTPPTPSRPVTSALPLVNPGFESGTKGWRSHSGHITLKAGTHPSRAHSGHGYVAATPTRAGYGFEQLLTTRVRSGDSYVSTIWLRTDSKSEKVVVVLAADGSSMRRVETTLRIGTTWARVTLKLSVPTGGQSDVRLSVYPHTAKLPLLGDDSSIIRTR